MSPLLAAVVAEAAIIVYLLVYGLRLGWRLHDAQLTIAILRDQSRGACHDGE